MRRLTICRLVVALAAVGLLVLLLYQDFRLVAITSSPASSLQQSNHSTAAPQLVASFGSYLSPSTNKSNQIRSFGCNLTATPFIFVHIGKAGGGNVRRRFAGSALNYTRAKWTDTDHSYYPVRRHVGEEEVLYRATFCNSFYHNYRPVNVKTFEGTQVCTATSPLGQALACPDTFRSYAAPGCPADPAKMESAHIVYTSHNYFGGELHWLPAPYLQEWWRQSWSLADSNTTTDPIAELWKSLDGKHAWCNETLRRPKLAQGRLPAAHEECGRQLEPVVDNLALEWMSSQFGFNAMNTSSVQLGRAWASIYTSLPVLRVTVLREPWSWLMSKFFWHRLHREKQHNLTCDNIDQATGSGAPLLPTRQDLGAHDSVLTPVYVSYETMVINKGPGWARKFALGYLLQLCGEDCIVRYVNGQASLEEIEAQAESNLRFGIAVVGLLHETDTFFQMVSARVDYMDTSLNPDVDVEGGTHKSPRSDESERCKERFQKDADFQQRFLASAPELAALLRLYEVGVEVNRFQLNELQQCSGTTFISHAGKRVPLNLTR